MPLACFHWATYCWSAGEREFTGIGYWTPLMLMMAFGHSSLIKFLEGRPWLFVHLRDQNPSLLAVQEVPRLGGLPLGRQAMAALLGCLTTTTLSIQAEGLSSNIARQRPQQRPIVIPLKTEVRLAETPFRLDRADVVDWAGVNPWCCGCSSCCAYDGSNAVWQGFIRNCAEP